MSCLSKCTEVNSNGEGFAATASAVLTGPETACHFVDDIHILQNAATPGSGPNRCAVTLY